MDRRQYLAAFAAAVSGGCAAPGTTGGSDESTTANAAEYPMPDDLPVPETELERGALRDAIPAITDPAFGADWSGVAVEVRNEFGEYAATPRLADGDRVVGVERDGRARAYPLRVLVWHEVVNDAFGGPLLVTYCPLCGSSLVAKRLVRGEETVFGVSGQLWWSNLVLYDRATDSLWSQLAATAIRGPVTGDWLTLVPSTLTTWADWRDRHPDTEVLRPPPESGSVVGRERAVRDYTFDPYGAYRTNDRVGLGGTFAGDLHPKTQVLGIAANGRARAYPFPAVERAGVVNDAVGGLPVVVAVTPDGTLVGYDRRVGGEPLRFERDGDATMRGGGSRWALSTGRAVDGPHRGTELASATDAPPLFWFAWRKFHPWTDLYDESRS
ncbi:DUF3179 domain-containing protein [Halomicrococcus sp. NG-SE-24]|uniref:DUF3179 domain-containing protein n=1 Tax=Halomicrococcus sp. NG-SE-24 TaxID=3436928 RepID=UPI003D958685